jgi:DNA-binding MarR family transcriptional regulator
VADAVSRLRRAMRRAARAQGGSFQPGAQPGTDQAGTQPETTEPETTQPGTLPGGLSVAQLEFLSCLAENPGARPGQLARLLRLAPSSVATLVNGLSRRQLIKRIGGVTDRRTAVLSLTADGSGVVASWQEVNAHILTVALGSLQPASREALRLALPALRELTGAVDALADEPRADEPRADEPRADESRAAGPPTADEPRAGEAPAGGP